MKKELGVAEHREKILNICGRLLSSRKYELIFRNLALGKKERSREKQSTELRPAHYQPPAHGACWGNGIDCLDGYLDARPAKIGVGEVLKHGREVVELRDSAGEQDGDEGDNSAR
eukprot:6199843-Pleurochrysis_carterae.AAC.1